MYAPTVNAQNQKPSPSMFPSQRIPVASHNRACPSTVSQSTTAVLTSYSSGSGIGSPFLMASSAAFSLASSTVSLDFLLTSSSALALTRISALQVIVPLKSIEEAPAAKPPPRWEDCRSLVDHRSGDV